MISDITAVREEAYRESGLCDLIAYTIIVLEENEVPLTIEHIAVCAFRLFPAKFALVGYPEYPDGMRVNRTLLQMQPKYRNWATGTATRGYSLTSAGRKAAELLRARIDGAVSSPHVNKGTETEIGWGHARTVHDEDVLKKIRGTELFRKFAEGVFSEARGLDFLAALDAFSHTPGSVVRKQLKTLTDAAKRAGDVQVQELLLSCKSKFGSLLKDH